MILTIIIMRVTRRVVYNFDVIVHRRINNNQVQERLASRTSYLYLLLSQNEEEEGHSLLSFIMRLFQRFFID